MKNKNNFFLLKGKIKKKNQFNKRLRTKEWGLNWKK
jgi:hypothetical protein